MTTKTYYVYILATRPYGPIYIGLTNNLVRRVSEHKAGKVSSHTRKYNIFQLVYYESFDFVDSAIRREKRLKKWDRPWKDELIDEFNREWRDLYYELL